MAKKLNNKIWTMGRNAFKSDNTLHGNGRAIEKRDIFLQVDEKAAEIDNSDLTCHVFSLEDVVAYLAISNPNNH